MSFLKKLAKGVTNVVSKATGIAAKLIPGPNQLLEGVSAVTGKVTSALNDKTTAKIKSAVAGVGAGAGSAGAGASTMAKAQAAAFSTDYTTGGGEQPKSKTGLIVGIVTGVLVVVGLIVWIFSRKKRK